jgi:hypothetical protein
MEMIWSILQSIADHHEMGDGFPFEEPEPQSKRLWLHSFRRNLPILDITKACLDSRQHFLVLPFSHITSLFITYFRYQKRLKAA